MLTRVIPGGWGVAAATAMMTVLVLVFAEVFPKTLAIMRSVGNGPRFVKRGRVFYFLDDLQSWIAERPRVRSAAQARFVA